MRVFTGSKILLLGPLLFAGSNASPWIGTQYVEVVENTVIQGYTASYLTEQPIVETSYIPVTPTATNIAVISTFTTIEGVSSDVTAVNLVVAPTAGVVPISNTFYEYYVNIVYTAPASCSYTTSATLTTAVPVFMPYDAEVLIKPTTVVTSTETYQYITNQITWTQAMLNPSDIPSSVYASVSSEYKPAQYTSCVRSYGSGSGSSSGSSGSSSGSASYSGCDEFTWYIGNSAFSGGYCCSDGCHYTWGLSPVGLFLAVFFSWFGFFFIFGLIESWFVFRRAMLGQKVRRGLPYGFAFLCPILSCLFLFTVKRHDAKTPDQQAWLAARWNSMSGGAKMGLWLKSFFNRRDPAAEALGFTGPVPPPPPSPGPQAEYPQGPYYPPSGSPPPGVPPMAAYPPPEQGYPTHPGYSPVPVHVAPQSDRATELSAEREPKTVSVNEAERSELP